MRAIPHGGRKPPGPAFREGEERSWALASCAESTTPAKRGEPPPWRRDWRATCTRGGCWCTSPTSHADFVEAGSRSAARRGGLARRPGRRSAGCGRWRALVEDRRAERLYRLVERRDDL